MVSSPPPSLPEGMSHKGRYLRLLTNAQLGSGLLFSSFLLVHLIPPALIAVTGEERSGSAFMLLGRVYYQGALSEPVVVYGSLAVHVVSSVLKRLLSSAPLKTLWTSSHSLSGLLLIPPIATHILTHRVGPSSPSPPISALSPAEMDYAFVASALDRWPSLSAVAYGAIVGLGLWHALGGLNVVRRRWGVPLAHLIFGDSRRQSASITQTSVSSSPPPPRGRRSALLSGRAVGTVLGSLVLAIGLYRLRNDAFVPSHLHRRVVESHRSVLPWLYK